MRMKEQLRQIELLMHKQNEEVGALVTLQRQSVALSDSLWQVLLHRRIMEIEAMEAQAHPEPEENRASLSSVSAPSASDALVHVLLTRRLAR